MPTSRGGKRPTALSVNRYRDSTQTSDMNTKALLQQSMDMQNWLNEKQVKVLQVMQNFCIYIYSLYFLYCIFGYFSNF